jgi:hypothetical protein
LAHKQGVGETQINNSLFVINPEAKKQYGERRPIRPSKVHLNCMLSVASIQALKKYFLVSYGKAMEQKSVNESIEKTITLILHMQISRS